MQCSVPGTVTWNATKCQRYLNLLYPLNSFLKPINEWIFYLKKWLLKFKILILGQFSPNQITVQGGQDLEIRWHKKWKMPKKSGLANKMHHFHPNMTWKGHFLLSQFWKHFVPLSSGTLSQNSDFARLFFFVLTPVLLNCKISND